MIEPNIKPTAQCELFVRVVNEIASLPDLINKVVEIDFERIRIYELPKVAPP